MSRRGERKLLRSWAAALVVVLGTSGTISQAIQQTDDEALARLEREFARLARGGGGMMGVAAVHIETGRAAYLNRNEAFPMASSYKVPIAVQLLDMVDRGLISLDKMIEVGSGDLHPGSGTLSSLFDDPGVSLSLHNLLELMLLISDNSATDMTLRAAGGGEAVTTRMRILGINGIRVDRPTVLLIANSAGIEKWPEGEEMSMDVYRRLRSQVPREKRLQASAAFADDPRDTSTPEGMGRLLTKIWKGEALSETSTDLLKDIMRRCRTGAGRIKGILPPRTVVAHKTGTIGGTTNDMGVITLPDGAGHVAVAILIKGSDRAGADREAAIAQVARAAHDFFLFNRE